MSATLSPQFIVNSVAPIRICDNGGWTDTWFARHGQIFNIAVYPCVEVQVAVYPRLARPERIVIIAENYGERYAAHPELGWDRHPLLEACIQSIPVPEDLALEVRLYSDAPPGASTGTSAAVSVALIGALDRLTPGRMTPYQVAQAALHVETDLLGLQSGIQDQICAAYGGLNYIEMPAYPNASISQIQVPNDIWWELERRLALVYLGRSHHSSQVHELVIRSLENAGPDCRQLEDLRLAARRSRDALYARDFLALGQAMIANVEAQKRLHPGLVSRDAQTVMDIAREYGALGWKVNGAGGEGGSLAILCGPDSAQKRLMLQEIEQESPLFKNIPIYLSRDGLRVWT
jgi:D-glycero-alpha-D-manno-heptose-7-phosphate kinase